MTSMGEMSQKKWWQKKKRPQRQIEGKRKQKKSNGDCRRVLYLKWDFLINVQHDSVNTNF
jgi:hypothetical protein